jgi:hypothetical protein
VLASNIQIFKYISIVSLQYFSIMIIMCIYTKFLIRYLSRKEEGKRRFLSFKLEVHICKISKQSNSRYIVSFQHTMYGLNDIIELRKMVRLNILLTV